MPDSATISKALEHAEKIRHNAAKCGKKMDERMIRKDKRKCRNDVFTMKEMVLVRLGSKRSGKGAPKRRYVVKGKILKISSWSENYKLSVIRPGETTPTETWTLTENIAKIKSNPKDNKKPSRSWFLIPLTKNDRLNMIENQGYELIFNPPGVEVVSSVHWHTFFEHLVTKLVPAWFEIK